VGEVQPTAHITGLLAAQCWLKATGNRDEHRTLGSQSCESAVDYGHLYLTFFFIMIMTQIIKHSSKT